MEEVKILNYLRYVFQKNREMEAYIKNREKKRKKK